VARRERLEAVAPPTATELHVLRNVLDPKGLFLKKQSDGKTE